MKLLRKLLQQEPDTLTYTLYNVKHCLIGGRWVPERDKNIYGILQIAIKD